MAKRERRSVRDTRKGKASVEEEEEECGRAGKRGLI
jgi:hypothetical protein